MMIQFEIEKKAEELVTFYKDLIERRSGKKPPTPEYEDMTTLRWLAQEYPNGQDAREIITQYLTIDDEWLKKQGYPLRLLKKYITAAILNTESQSQLPKQVWVVAISQSGRPVTSHNQHAMKGHFKYTPMLWDDWVKADILGKLQKPVEKWQLAGNDVNQWIINWKHWDLLQNDDPFKGIY
jgi:hypothetical protein